MTRPQDQQPFVRSQHAAMLRIGTIAAVAGNGKSVDVTTPEGLLTAVPLLTSTTVTTVGAVVAVLIDRDRALVIGNVK